MSILEKGDRVRLLLGKYGISESNPAYEATGVEGSVAKMYSSNGRVRVIWDNNNFNGYYVSDLEKVDNPIIDIDDLFKDIEL